MQTGKSCWNSTHMHQLKSGQLAQFGNPREGQKKCWEERMATRKGKNNKIHGCPRFIGCSQSSPVLFLSLHSRGINGDGGWVVRCSLSGWEMHFICLERMMDVNCRDWNWGREESKQCFPYTTSTTTWTGGSGNSSWALYISVWEVIIVVSLVPF